MRPETVPPCPPFAYDHHPDRATVLPGRVAEVLIALRRGELDSATLAADTRPIHERLLCGLTPDGYAYYAGHYRGENYPCLLGYEVRIGHRLGCPAASVEAVMHIFAEEVRNILAALDELHQKPEVSDGKKLFETACVACWIFERLNFIHPYADGNGHASRFCVWSVLGRYGNWPTRWTIEPRPATTPIDYIEMLHRYRAGDEAPLVRHVLSCLDDSTE